MLIFQEIFVIITANALQAHLPGLLFLVLLQKFLIQLVTTEEVAQIQAHIVLTLLHQRVNVLVAQVTVLLEVLVITTMLVLLMEKVIHLAV
jgi:hypothetical protein